ncbi:MAG: hypothetical protein IJG50_01205 [Clostridia bacterium]|nr:hypothetical protein [Clostridia bacterium]
MAAFSAPIIEFCRKNKLLNTLMQSLYLSVLKPPSYWENKAQGQEPASYPPDGPVHKIKAAFVCDEMTWIDLSGQCESIFVRPGSWKLQFEAFHPDIFFCESAWSGVAPFDGCWRGRIYNNREVFFENRRILFDILDYCRQKGIPTVFWNKEDPIGALDTRFDFADTALHFDHIFTTAQESVDEYRRRGGESVHVLPFMVNTAVYYPDNEIKDDNRVLFAGAWYDDLPRRCRDTRALFDYVLSLGMDLDIYDRHSESVEERFKFPEEYREYIHKSIPTDRVPALMRKYSKAINVNTITDSKTMFSRRALQLAACGLSVISNPSEAMQRALGGRKVTAPNGEFLLSIEANSEMVRREHAASKAFDYVLNTLLKEGVSIPEEVYA